MKLKDTDNELLIAFLQYTFWILIFIDANALFGNYFYIDTLESLEFKVAFRVFKQTPDIFT